MSKLSLPPPAPMFAAGFATIASLGEIAVATGNPWLFPSLGPTAIMLFLSPRAAAASPRNAICGHAIGIAAGWLSLFVMGLLTAGPADIATLGHDRVVAAALALATTGAAMILLRVVHPPAGATTLIIALGLITRIEDLLVVELSVLVLVGEAFAVNRLMGVDCPLWNPVPADV